MLTVDDTKPCIWSAVPREASGAADTPRSALRRTSKLWDGGASQWLEHLRDFASGRRGSMSGPEAFAVVHLCGEKGVVRAHPIVCKLVADDRRIADWLDDAVTETLPGILIKTFNGNAALLRGAIESPWGDAFARASALAALGYLVRARGAMSNADMRAFLHTVRRDAPPRHRSILWMTWAMVAGNLGYSSMRSEVAALEDEGFFPGGDFGVDDFDERIALARRDASGLAGFVRDMIEPLDDAGAGLRWMAHRATG